MENKHEVAIKIIKLKEEITIVKQEAENERRKLKKDLNRKISEVRTIALGNKQDIKKVWCRADDNTDQLEKIQEALHMVFKVIITTVIGVIITGAFAYVMSLISK